MNKTKETQKEKYTSRNWMIVSPQGKHSAVVSFNRAVSFAFMEQHFPGWKMSALFKSEREIAEKKARNASKTTEKTKGLEGDGD